MISRYIAIPVAMGLVTFFTAGNVLAIETDNTAIQVGSKLPGLEAESLAGEELQLPESAEGELSVLIFSFSKQGGEAAAAWWKAIHENTGSQHAVQIWQVLVLEGVPRLLRGFVESGIKRGIPQSQHERALKLYHDKESWMQRLGVTSEDDPGVVLLDAAGEIRWLRSGTMNDSLLSDLQTRLQRE